MRTHTLIRWGGLAALLASIISIAIEIALLATIGNQAYGVAAQTSQWSVLYTLRLIATILPSLEVFNIQAAVATGVIVHPSYLGYAFLYCAAYSAAAILLAFILFEDRDLA